MKGTELGKSKVLVWGHPGKNKWYNWDSNPVFQTLNPSAYLPHYAFYCSCNLLNRKSVPLEKGEEKGNHLDTYKNITCAPLARTSLDTVMCLRQRQKQHLWGGSKLGSLKQGAECGVLWLGGSNPPVFREHLSHTGHFNIQNFSPCLHGFAV